MLDFEDFEQLMLFLLSDTTNCTELALQTDVLPQEAISFNDDHGMSSLVYEQERLGGVGDEHLGQHNQGTYGTAYQKERKALSPVVSPESPPNGHGANYWDEDAIRDPNDEHNELSMVDPHGDSLYSQVQELSLEPVGLDAGAYEGQELEPDPSQIVLRPGEKELILFRHGRSLAQDAPSSRLWAADLLDCGLSQEGWEQAEALRATLEDFQFDLVVCSPLTKALQTALIIFQDRTCPIVVHSTLGGDPGGPPEATPRPVAELLADRHLAALPRFDKLDFSPLGEGWPETRPPGGPQALLPWLRRRPEVSVAVVGLFGVLRRLLPEVPDIPNCEPLRCALTDQGLQLT